LSIYKLEIDKDILKRIGLLQNKYAALGQDLASYLDGLIFSNPITYWDYIEIDTLLSLQKPKTDYPDEKIFIVYHQITELYFSLVLHELEQISNNGKKISELGQDLGWNKALNPKYFKERLSRINLYFETLINSFDIMRFGMEKEQFVNFRMTLLSSSGFQTVNYRKIEIFCTDISNLVFSKKREELKDASLKEQLNNIYWRGGAIVEETGEKTLTLKDFEEKYLDELHQYAKNKESINIWKKYKSLSKEEQEDKELISLLKQLDLNINVKWPLVHVKTAAHYLSKKDKKTKGTGGTNWQKYLPPKFQKRIFYPELWSTKEKDEWGRSWVEEQIS
jgi:tryptophan 2,3-dioxygenase